jgi:hypothetical protein
MSKLTVNELDIGPLTVGGVIESTTGGVKFPDGTTMTSAAASVDAKTTTKAWVATGYGGANAPTDIKSSYNISSVTEPSNAYYVVNFTTSMTDSDYVVVAKSTRDSNYTDSNTQVTVYGKETGLFKLKSGAPSEGHANYGAGSLNVVVFGN